METPGVGTPADQETRRPNHSFRMCNGRRVPPVQIWSRPYPPYRVTSSNTHLHDQVELNRTIKQEFMLRNGAPTYFQMVV